MFGLCGGRDALLLLARYLEKASRLKSQAQSASSTSQHYRPALPTLHTVLTVFAVQRGVRERESVCERRDCMWHVVSSMVYLVSVANR